MSLYFEDYGFIYDKQIFTKGKAVQLVSGYELFQEFGDFSIEQDVFLKLKKLPTLMYISSTDEIKENKKKNIKNKEATYIKIKPSKTAKELDLFLPVEMFRVVKIPKMNDVLDWIYNNDSLLFPSGWSFFKNELDTVSRYLIRIFQTKPRLLKQVSDITNHLYNTHKAQDIFIYYKTIIKENNVFRSELYNEFNGKTAKKEFIDICQQLNPYWSIGDATSCYILNAKKIFKKIDNISNNERVFRYKNPNSTIMTKKNNEEFEEGVKVLNEKLIKIEKDKMLKDNRFLKELNQEIIDELELTIFNTSSLKNLNSVLITFIDKFNNKRFYLEDFRYYFYVSSYQSVIHNDFVVSRDEAIHTKYLVKDFKVLQNIKYNLNSSYQTFMLKGGIL